MDKWTSLASNKLSLPKRLLIRLGFFGLGALVLCGFSILQKALMGQLANALFLHAYTVPVLYGGATGLLIGEWFLRLKKDALIIQEDEERLRTLINAMPDFVIFKDGDGCWMDVNQVGEQLFEFSQIPYRGKNDLQLAEQAPPLRELLHWCHTTDEEAWNKGIAIHCQANSFYLNGKQRTFDLVKVPLAWPDGTRKGMVIIGRDITELKESELQLVHAYDSTLAGWAKAVEMRDKPTEDHTRRVVVQTEKLARLMGVLEPDLTHIRRGAMLHDVGKIGVPDIILGKPSKLTAEEMGVMLQHPTRAFEMLDQIEFLRPALDIPYCHHEHWDGSGYPRGLQGEAIPFPARIFAVIDVWDALTSDRPYRRAWTEEQALDFIRQESGRQFDPQVVAVFLENIKTVKDAEV